MCIQLHLEEATKVIKRRQLKNLNQLFGMKENCYGVEIQDLKIFNYFKGDRLSHSFYMHPE
jgi:hypothetical protein